MDNTTEIKRMPRATRRPSKKPSRTSTPIMKAIPESSWFGRAWTRNRSAPAPLSLLPKRPATAHVDSVVPLTPDRIHLDWCIKHPRELPRLPYRQTDTQFVVGHDYQLRVVEPTMTEVLEMEVERDGKTEPLAMLRPATSEGLCGKVCAGDAWDTQSCTASLEGEGKLARVSDEKFGDSIKRRVKGLFRSVKK